MDNKDWYSSNSWYSPLNKDTKKSTSAAGPEFSTGAEKKKGWTPLRITGFAVLMVVLIVASSLVCAKAWHRDIHVLPPGTEYDPFDSELPEDFDDFVENFYQKVEKAESDINIPQAKLPVDFVLETEKASGRELSLKELYEKCSPSVVAIAAYTENKSGYNWGTGVVLSSDGLILTNTHVINECDSAKVTLFDDREFEAELLGADLISDIAVLKIDAEGLTAAQFGDSSQLSVGDSVAAIGNPLGETFRSTLTDGIISAIERGITHNGHSMSLLQTNTAINEGNSGGALFNMYGQVIGITNMKMMSSYSSIEGIGFAIPSNNAANYVNSICRYGAVKGRPSIGITVGGIPEMALAQYELPEGLYVSDVQKNSDAYAKGMRVGDVVTEVNGVPVSSIDQVNELKSGLSVGDTMIFKVWRQGEILEFEVKLMDTNDVY